jgi:chromosome segregation ATPase
MTDKSSVSLIVNPEVGAVKVITEPAFLHQASEAGWSLIAILQEQDHRTVQVHKTDTNGYTHYEDTIQPITVTSFVMRQSQDETLSSMQKKLIDYEERLHEVTDELNQLRTEYETLDKNCADIQQQDRASRNETKRILQELNRSRSMQQTLEKDLGNYRNKLFRVEKALGKIRMDEILNTAEEAS